MSSRKARNASAAAAARPEAMPPSARVAWGYLAALLAVIVSGLMVLLVNAAVSPLLCGASDDVGDCKFNLAVWVAIGSLAIALVPIALLLKLDGWFVAAVMGLAGLMISLDAVDQPWWWALALLVPAASALVGADYERGRRLRAAQYVVVLLLDVAAVVALAFWYLND